MNWLFAPPLAFAANVVLVGLLVGLGRILAGTGQPNPAKTSLYTGGEAIPVRGGVPGYRPFFVTALFFAVLHLGVLMLGSSQPSSLAMLYLLGLMLALLALIMG